MYNAYTMGSIILKNINMVIKDSQLYNLNAKIISYYYY